MSYPTKKLGEVVSRIVGGGTPSMSNASYWGGSIPWASVKDIKEDTITLERTQDFITEEGLKNSASNVVPMGTLIISTRMGLGRIVKSKIDTAINQDLKALFPKEELNSDYLLWFLKSKAKDFIEKGTGATVSGIRLEYLKSIEIPMPPVGEQRKIVARTEKQFAQIDEAARLRTASWVLTEKLLPAALHKIFSFAGSNGWEEKSLGEICNIKSGGTPSKSVSKYWDGGDIPWLRSEACRDEVIRHAERFITREGLQNSSAQMFQPRTTLLALVGATIGRTGFLMFESATNQNIAGLYPKNEAKLLPEYLFVMAQGLYPKFLEIGAGKFKMANLTFVRSLKIPIPLLAEQKAIVKKFDALAEKTRGLQELQKQQTADLKALKQSILAENFKI